MVPAGLHRETLHPLSCAGVQVRVGSVLRRGSSLCGRRRKALVYVGGLVVSRPKLGLVLYACGSADARAILV